MTEIKLYVLLKLKKKCKDFFQITILNILGNMKPEHLKKMRELSGLTQGQLGLILGFKVTNGDCSPIAWRESGRAKTKPELAKRWANACGFEITENNQVVVDIDLYFQTVEKAQKYDSIIKTININAI